MDWLRRELGSDGSGDNDDVNGENEIDDDYILFDCPGQIELYTHMIVVKQFVDILQNESVISQFWESARPRRRIQKSTIQDARQEIKRSCGGAQGQRSFALGLQGEEEVRHPPRQLFQVHLQGVQAGTVAQL